MATSRKFLGYSELQSRTIDLMRFPLCVLVVFIHTSTTLELSPVAWGQYPLLSEAGMCNVIELFFVDCVSQIAVPVFFVISGYLFFKNLEVWKWKNYGSKLKSRAKTVLVPYLCWVTISYLCIAGIPAISTWIESGSLGEALHSFAKHRYGIWYAYVANVDYTLYYPDWFGNAIIDYGHFYPVMWYVRNLMVAMICAPLFYGFVKLTRIYGMVVLCVFYLSNHGFISTTVFYFAMGAYLATNGLNIVEVACKISRLSVPISVVSLIALTCCGSRELSLAGFRIYPFFVISGVWSAFYIASCIVRKMRVVPNKFLAQSSFFVFALHFMKVLDGWNASLLSYSFRTVSGLFAGIPHMDLLVFFISPALTIVVCLGLFALLRRYTPRLCGVLVGNRC